MVLRHSALSALGTPTGSSTNVCSLLGMSLDLVVGIESKDCSASRVKEENKIVLFNDALNTFYLRLYGLGHMVNDH